MPPFLLLLLLAPFFPVVSSVEDAFFLFNFKRTVISDPNNALGSWRLDSPSRPCDWLGVECDTKVLSTGVPVVRGISLPNQNIAGRLWPDLGKLAFLRYLNLSSNRIMGNNIFDYLTGATALETIDFSNNLFAGVIPSASKLTRLKTLILFENMIEGDFPAGVCDGGALRNIDLTANELEGVITSDISKCSALETLILAENSLSGPIPAALADLPRLRILDLSDNQLSGDLPPNLGNIPYLTHLKLSNNRLTGFLSPLISVAKFIVMIDVRFNRIGGTIPPSLGDMAFLERLQLTDNRFQGQIPRSLGKLAARLSYVDVAHNMLTGGIPPALGNLSRLVKLILNHNKLTGPLPEFTESTSLLIDINLSYNLLTGSIPTSIQYLSSLQYLSLGYNQLSGHIPPGIGYLVALSMVDVSNNNLSGIIPDVFGSLTELTSFKGPHNHLTGSLPRSLENLTKLRTFDVSYNNLSGLLPDVPLFRHFYQSGYLQNESGLCGPIVNVSCPSPDATFEEVLGDAYIFLKSKADQVKYLPYLVVSILGVTILMFMVGGLFLKIAKPKLFDELVEFCDVRVSFLTQYCGGRKRLSYRDIQLATEHFGSTHVIGSSSRYKVYLGEFPGKGILAVKVLNPELIQETQPHFLGECRILSNINHDNVMQILDWCYRTDVLAVICKYMARGSLHDNLFGSTQTSTTDLSWEVRLRIAVDIAVGLAFLHEQGKEERFLLCQLCPENILLDETCTPKIGGLQVIRKSDPVVVVDGALDGKRMHRTYSEDYVDYLPPECASEGEVSEQGEVYSYGLTVLELITGKKATLPDMIRACFPDKVLEHVDPRVLQTIRDSDQVLALMEIGLSCTEADPLLRPTMETVVSILTRISQVESSSRLLRTHTS